MSGPVRHIHFRYGDGVRTPRRRIGSTCRRQRLNDDSVSRADATVVLAREPRPRSAAHCNKLRTGERADVHPLRSRLRCSRMLTGVTGPACRATTRERVVDVTRRKVAARSDEQRLPLRFDGTAHDTPPVMLRAMTATPPIGQRRAFVFVRGSKHYLRDLIKRDLLLLFAKPEHPLRRMQDLHNLTSALVRLEQNRPAERRVLAEQSAASPTFPRSTAPLCQRPARRSPSRNQ